MTVSGYGWKKIYYSPDLPSLCKSSKTLGPTPSDLLVCRECLDIWMEDDIETATTTCIVVDYEVETTKGTISHLKIAGKECIEIGLTLSEIKEEIKMHNVCR